MTQPALDFIRNTHSAKYRLMALAITTRSNAQYFRNSENKILGLLVGVLDYPIKYDTTLPDPVQLSSFLKNVVEIVPGPYRGLCAETPPPRCCLKQEQTRVQGELGIETVLACLTHSTGQLNV